jgi:hypothetical protein
MTLKPPPDSGPHPAYPAFSLPLQRHYYRAGREACMSMGEHQPMIVYMEDQISKLIAGLDDPASTAEALRYWSKGFESALFERLNHWQGRQREFLDLLDGRARVDLPQASKRITRVGPKPSSGFRKTRPLNGTLHCCVRNPWPTANDIDDDPNGSAS